MIEQAEEDEGYSKTHFVLPLNTVNNLKHEPTEILVLKDSHLFFSSLGSFINRARYDVLTNNYILEGLVCLGMPILPNAHLIREAYILLAVAPRNLLCLDANTL